MARKQWINNLNTEKAIEVYDLFRLTNTKYSTKFDSKKQPVNGLVLRNFVRTFLRKNHLGMKHVNVARGARAAGMDSGVFDFNVK